MLYMVGTLCETDKLETKLPVSVFTELVRGIAVLDSKYGENRNYQECGGYSLIAETTEDIQEIKNYMDYESHPAEWVTSIGKDSSYLSALYILNDDFSIMLYMPAAIAPTVILDKMVG